MADSHSPSQPSSTANPVENPEVSETRDPSKSTTPKRKSDKRKKSTVRWRDVVNKDVLTPKDRYPLLHSKKLRVLDLDDGEIQNLCTTLYDDYVSRSTMVDTLQERCTSYEKRIGDLRASEHSNKHALCVLGALGQAIDPLLESCELCMSKIDHMYSRVASYSREVKKYVAHLSAGQGAPTLDFEEAFGPGSVDAGPQDGNLSALALAADTDDAPELLLHAKALRTSAHGGTGSQFIMHLIKVEAGDGTLDSQERLVVSGLYVLQMELRSMIEYISNKKVSDMSNMVKNARYRVTLMKGVLLASLAQKHGSAIHSYLSDKLPDNASQGVRFIHISDLEGIMEKIIVSKGVGARQKECLMSLCTCLQQNGLQQEMDPDRLDIEGDNAGPGHLNDNIIYINDEVDFFSRARARGWQAVQPHVVVGSLVAFLLPDIRQAYVSIIFYVAMIFFGRSG
eukprot:jgi/Picsp_1/1903/NSC_05369-R1_---NA---